MANWIPHEAFALQGSRLLFQVPISTRFAFPHSHRVQIGALPIIKA